MEIIRNVLMLFFEEYEFMCEDAADQCDVGCGNGCGLAERALEGRGRRASEGGGA